MLKHIVLVCIVLVSAPCLANASPPDGEKILSRLDDYFSEAVRSKRVSGLAMGMVIDGEMIGFRAYGMEDPESGASVDPAATLFSIGSITKTFTANAVAQLHARGLIESLDDPANKYLQRIQLPDWNGQPISVSHLLTHRAGLDESVYGLIAQSSPALPLAPGEISKRIPRQVRPPGKLVVYSNAGYGVLGILVEDVSGLVLGDYFRTHILEPLGMDNTYLRYAIDAPRKLSLPFKFKSDGSAEPIPQNWIYHPFIAPSAGLVSTASDMLRYLSAHLGVADSSGAGIVDADIARAMHTRIADNHPAVSGFGMSLIVHQRNGYRIVENAGSGPGYQALFILLPDIQSGFVVLMMGGGVSLSLVEKLDHWLHGDDEDATTIAGIKALNMFEARQFILREMIGSYTPTSASTLAAPPAENFTGLFRNERRSHSTVEAIISRGNTIEVTQGKNGSLLVNDIPGYRPVPADLLWNPDITPFVPDPGSSDIYALIRDDTGSVNRVIPHLGVDAYLPVRVKPETVLYLGALLLLAGASGILQAFGLRNRLANKTSLFIVVLLGLANLGFIVQLARGFTGGSNPLFSLAFGDTSFFRLLIINANIIVALALLYGLSLLPKRELLTIPASTGGRLAYLHKIIVLLAGLLMLLVFDYYNLIAYRLP